MTRKQLFGTIVQVERSYNKNNRKGNVSKFRIFGDNEAMKKKKIAASVLIIGGLLCALWMGIHPGGKKKVQDAKAVKQIEETGKKKEQTVFAGASIENLEELEKIQKAGLTGSNRKKRHKKKITKDQIYSFLQGPRAWEEKRDWSGEWYQVEINGRRFGSFGCGFCCMANIYDTLSKREGSPLEMCNYVTKVTEYYPSSESGAVSWEHMEKTLQKCGMETALRRKPKSYKRFQKQMRKNPTMIVLISSSYDTKFWTDTGGHYVNIWDYDAKKDEVFLAEPGDPDKNRCRMPLRYVYDALKEVSPYQYLIVRSYDPKKDEWRPQGINENWNRPKRHKGHGNREK